MTERWRDRAAALAAVLVIVVAAFVFRFNALGGSLGGFDNDDFATLTRVDMLLTGQQVLRDFSDPELRGVWPSLSFEIPALAQRIWGRNLFVYGWLTLGALAACAAVTFLVARALSRQWAVGLLAAAAFVASMPVPYNYPKVVTVAVAIPLIWWMLHRPTPVRLAVLAAWTVAAILFRHDYGVYVAVGVVTGLVAREPLPLRIPARRIAVYAGFGLLVALPSLVWIARHAGIAEHVGSVLQSVRADAATTPPLGGSGGFNLSSPFDQESLVALMYRLFWTMPLVGAAVWVMSRRDEGLNADPGRRAIGVAMIAMTPVVNVFFLRSGLAARFGDAIVPVLLVGAWVAGAAPTLRPSGLRRAAQIGPPLLFALMSAAFVPMREVRQELAAGGFLHSPAAVVSTFGRIRRGLEELPPDRWSGRDAPATLAASRYLAECTADDDYVLVGLYADEVPYFARRRFAGGQPYFGYSQLTSEADQRRVIERLGRQSTPVALTAMDFEGEMASDYPLVAHYLAERYREVGVIDSDGEPFARVFVETARHPTGVDDVLGFPCFR